jgi:hypothetical protein
MHPCLYATQTGYWDLSGKETGRLGEYLRRGGFLVVDGFHGPREWEVFAASMARVLPWEHTNMPDYPEAMTSLAYRFGINYVVYAMTH